MGILHDLEQAIGFTGSDSDSYHDSGLDDITHGIVHGIKDIAPAAFTLGILVGGLKIMSDSLSGKKKR